MLVPSNISVPCRICNLYFLFAQVIPNLGGELSTNYPSTMVFLESEKSPCLSSTSVSLKSDSMRNDASSSSSSSTTTPNYLLAPECPSFTDQSSTHVIGQSLACSAPSYKNVLMSSKDSKEDDGNSVEASKLKELCSRARLARCRARFPIPVILYDNKHICRSEVLLQLNRS